uniref:Uncharacterized protein n=1 Tax=Rhizophora mucronata TaxID=61149 RepID=A0A2P2PEP3_RHIMU
MHSHLIDQEGEAIKGKDGLNPIKHKTWPTIITI